MSIGYYSGLAANVDGESVLRSLQDLIESDGLTELCFGSAEQFLDSEARNKPACLIVDIRMPGMSGPELQAKLRAKGCQIPIIFITTHGDAGMRTLAMREGAVEFLSKPFDDELLLEAVNATLDGRRRNA